MHKRNDNVPDTSDINKTPDDTLDVFADLEATLDEVAEANPRIDNTKKTDSMQSEADLEALLEVSMAVNSSLVLDDVLQIVMSKAVELMQAERGLIMLLDNNGELQVRSAFNLSTAEMLGDNFKVSKSITSEVAKTGKTIYTSDAMSDQRYAKQQSVVELHLRSIMCVPLKVKDKVVGVIYLDNSSQSRMFLKSDLYLFELYAQMVSNALHNARLYDSVVSLQRYNEQVIKHAPFGTVVIDNEGKIATINAAALEIFDFNKDDITCIGQEGEPSYFTDLLIDKEKAHWQHMINKVITSKQEFADSRYFHNTGYLEKALSIKISPIKQLPHSNDGMIIAVEDITDKVIMEKYVILSEKLVAKGELAASIAHELNNFLAIASNNAELIAINIDRGNYEKVKFNASAVVENVQKIKRFVENLMDFSRPESEIISYDLKHLIEDLLFSLRTQARFKTTHFTIDIDPNIPNIEMDVGQVQQVLMNLLNNAADANEEKAVNLGSDEKAYKQEIKITAKYDKASEQVTIKISDNGIGMTPETLDKIFNLHFTTKKGGHGLGLSNCKTIIEQHNGELLCESELGVGTTFTIVLPHFQPQTEEKTVQ